jgi:hypothetical protein
VSSPVAYASACEGAFSRNFAVRTGASIALVLSGHSAVERSRRMKRYFGTVTSKLDRRELLGGHAVFA